MLHVCAYAYGGTAALQYIEAAKQHLHDIIGPHMFLLDFFNPQLDFVTIGSWQGGVLLTCCTAALGRWLSVDKLKLLPETFPEELI